MSAGGEITEGTSPPEAFEPNAREAETITLLAANRRDVLRRLARDRPALAGLLVIALC